MKNKPKTSAAQLARVRDWERRNPERAQARKDAWAQSPAGKAWLVENQAKKNKARDKWRARKKREALLRARKSKKATLRPSNTH